MKRNGYIVTDGQSNIVWSKSSIIPMDRVGNCGLYRWNVEGREKNGRISNQDLSRQTKNLRTKFRIFSGQKDFQLIDVSNEENGTNGGPDFIVKLPDFLLLNNSLDVEGDISRQLTRPIYDHESAGIGVLYLPGVFKGNQRISGTVLDLAPTILHLLGINIPVNMDGTVLSDAFSPTWSKSVVESGSSVRKVHNELLENTDENVLNQLKSLGYLNSSN